MESSQRGTTKSRLGAARLWLHPLLWRHLNAPLLVFLDTFVILSLTNAVLLVSFQLVYPIFQGCVELLSLLNTAGNQENLHLSIVQSGNSNVFLICLFTNHVAPKFGVENHPHVTRRPHHKTGPQVAWLRNCGVIQAQLTSTSFSPIPLLLVKDVQFHLSLQHIGLGLFTCDNVNHVIFPLVRVAFSIFGC